MFYYLYPGYDFSLNLLDISHHADLIKHLIHAYDSVPKIDKSMLLNALCRAIVCSYQLVPMQAVPTSPLILVPSFLRRIILDADGIRKNGLKAQVDTWLKLVMTLIYTAGCEWRVVLCCLTEDTLQPVMQEWHCHDTMRQRLLMRYLNTVMALHHPHHGGSSPKSCHLVQDKQAWRQHLVNLYQLVAEFLSIASEKSSKTTSIHDSSQSTTSESQLHLLAVLAARVCCEVFSDQEGVLDTSVVSSGDRSKRRRLDVCLPTLLASLREDAEAHRRTAMWYTVLEKMLKDHSSFWSGGNHCPLLLSTLVHLLENARLLTAHNAVLRVLCCLCQVWPRHKQGSEPQWVSVWIITMRLVRGQQCLGTGLRLLRLMLQGNMQQNIPLLCNSLCSDLQQSLARTEEGLLIIEHLLITKKMPKRLRMNSIAEESVETDSVTCFMHALLPLCSSNLQCDHSLLYRLLLMLCDVGNGFLPPIMSTDTSTTAIPLDRCIYTVSFLPPKPLSKSALLQLHLNDIERVYVATSLTAEYPSVRRLVVPCAPFPEQELKSAIYSNSEETAMTERKLKYDKTMMLEMMNRLYSYVEKVLEEEEANSYGIEHRASVSLQLAHSVYVVLTNVDNSR